MKYENEVKYLWENYVPNQGESNILQAELIRIIEQLRYEATYNLNANWNQTFEKWVAFLKLYLPEQSDILDEILNKGKYARQYYDGLVPLDVDEIAIYDDSIYDFLLDQVIELYYLYKELKKII